MIIFETDRLRVRQLQRADRSFYLQLFGDSDVVRFIRPPQTEETIDGFLSDHLSKNSVLFPGGRFIVEELQSGIGIGSFVVIPIEAQPDFQIGYAFLKEYWGRGLATELIQAGIAYAFEVCELTQLFALIEVHNLASQKVVEKAGFHFFEMREENGVYLKCFRLLKPKTTP